jgi:SAM-dependent methyltransferase
MHGQDATMFSRTWNRVKRLTNRTGQRLRGLPLRASYRRSRTPIPPGRLIHLVAGSEDVAWFLEGGGAAAQCLRDVLSKNGRSIESFTKILDFGCGAGRVMRHWSNLHGPRLHGADYHPDLVSWCKTNLPFAEFQVNGVDRRLVAEDETFDLVYALSVFTHLPEALQAFWIEELTRVLRPGGFLFITTHGRYYLEQLSHEERARFEAGQLVVRGSTRKGSNDCAAFHPESYVRSKLAEKLALLDFIPEGALGNPRQDVILLQKPFVLKRS